MCRVVVLTCVFVVGMCFLTRVAASLLEEESSPLHHEEALAKAAKTNGKGKKKLLETSVVQWQLGSDAVSAAAAVDQGLVLNAWLSLFCRRGCRFDPSR